MRISVQERVYDELQSIFAEKPLEKMNLADLREMKFLEHCILETLRLYPTGPAIARTLSKDLQLGNYEQEIEDTWKEKEKKLNYLEVVSKRTVRLE